MTAILDMTAPSLRFGFVTGIRLGAEPVLHKQAEC
jgi:hypothetical protein